MSSGVPGPTDGGGETDRRVTALEKAVENIDRKLDKIIEAQVAERLSSEQRFGAAAEASEQRFGAAAEASEKRFGGIAERLASIEGKLDAKASASDLTRIAGRVESLPTTWQMITLVFGILGGAFLILKFGLPHAL